MVNDEYLVRTFPFACEFQPVVFGKDEPMSLLKILSESKFRDTVSVSFSYAGGVKSGAKWVVRFSATEEAVCVAFAGEVSKLILEVWHGKEFVAKLDLPSKE